MRYFIGFLISGEAREWHHNCIAQISDKFNTWKLHEKIPPHVTVLYTFETDDLTPVRDLLKQWASSVPQGTLTLSDYDHFGDTVVYAKVEIEEELRHSLEKLREKLRHIPHLPPDHFPIWNPHSTLMNKVPEDEIIKIWEYLLGLPKPNFVLPFDNITIFRYEGDQKWMVDEIIKTHTV